MNTAFIVIIAFFSIAVIIIVSELMTVSYPEGSVRGFTVTEILRGPENISERLDDIVHRVMWTDDELISRVVIVGIELYEAQKLICMEMCRKYEYIVYTDFDEFQKNILNIYEME